MTRAILKVNKCNILIHIDSTLHFIPANKTRVQREAFTVRNENRCLEDAKILRKADVKSQTEVNVGRDTWPTSNSGHGELVYLHVTCRTTESGSAREQGQNPHAFIKCSEEAIPVSSPIIQSIVQVGYTPSLDGSTETTYKCRSGRFYWMSQPGVVISGFIAIDKFPKDNAIEYYFLTHAHSDHYVAIDNKWNNGEIYCSPVTANILPVVTLRARSKRAGIRSNLIHPLELNIWHRMNGFSVMLLDANHIPGSVMFLFDGDRISDGRILFTGDFRADVRFYQNVFAMSVLQEKRFKTIYLDTTYINCTREEFPSREVSLGELCNLLHKLLFDDPSPIMIMVPKVGREQLLVDTAIQFKCKIWVDHVRWKVAEILGITEYFTTEKTETPIWTCARQTGRSVFYDANVRIIDASMLPNIKPSSMINLMGVDDMLIEAETDGLMHENELSPLVASSVLSRIELANDHALRSAFGEILQHAAVDDQNPESNPTDQSQYEKVAEETDQDSDNLLEAINNEDDYIFNMAVQKISRAVNVENLAQHICVDLNVNESAEGVNPLHEFLSEMDISKAVETLDDLSEKYREAVDAMRKTRTVHDMNLPYIAEEHVVYDASQGPVLADIPLEWLDESESMKDVVIVSVCCGIAVLMKILKYFVAQLV
uniref:Metallo-beta-lactamase domain-containing protein n=1 Tax=Setaria digitata TaxID=48799 RepID=A0A915PH00_9BILA